MEPGGSALRAVFTEAAEIADPAARAAFLESACRGDPVLRGRVERLLKADSQAGDFLGHRGDDSPAALRGERVGERIGRYRLVERIGRGGCGVVYLAEQEEPVRRRVALKVIKLGMDTQSVVARFEVERQALAIMDHPNIARVLDAGATEAGRPFFVMELVSGLRITDYCERHRLTTRQRLELFIPVCQAVQHAHQKGIVHRDLKPSNILVTEHEGVPVPKVIDFGIAKATGPGWDDLAGLTGLNQFIGTPAYMSPEQVEFCGNDIDTRSDVYSLGVVLYELLTGQPPFDPKALAGAALDEMRRIIREVDPPRPSTTITRRLDAARPPPSGRRSHQLIASVRGDMDWIVMKCLEKDRARRYETANGLAMDLRRHLENEPVVARPPARLYRLEKVIRRHRIAFSVAGLVTLILVGAVIVSARSAVRARRAEREQGRLRDLAEARAGESRQRLVRRYVAEGNRLVEMGRPVVALPWMVAALQLEEGDPHREPDERLRIAQALVGAPELRLDLAQGRTVPCLALSPDGRRLATGSDDGTVRILDVDRGGEGELRLAMTGVIGRVRFSPDGTRLVAVDMAGRARVWNAAGGEALSPVLQAADFSEDAIRDVAQRLKPAAVFSPDGGRLLVAWGSKSAQLRDANTGDLVREFHHGAVVYDAVFSPDGRLVATSGRDGTARIWDAQTGNPAGPALEHSARVTWAQFSSDGQKLMTVRDRHFVQLWDWREGRRLAPEIPRRSVLFHASLSPDASRILTVAWSGYAHVYDTASSRLINQFEHGGGLVDAAFSPDGRHVATACHDGNVWLWDTDDSARRPMVLPEGNQIEKLDFSGDGRRLAVGTRGGHARVWDLFPPERGVQRMPGNDVACVEFDPTGRRALVVSTGSESGLGIYDTQTGKQLGAVPVPPDELSRARFSPDGRRVLAFGRGRSLRVLDAESGREVVPALNHEQGLRDALWSPDGSRIVTAAGAVVLAWNAESGKVSATFPNATPVTAIALSRDGTRLAIGAADGSVQIRDPRSGRPVAGPFNAPGPVDDVAFVPDGRRLGISCRRGAEGVLEVRDAVSGATLGRPLVHRDHLGSLEFSRDGRLLATACDDHTARVWDAATGEPVTPWLPHGFETRQALFSPDGSRLVTLARRGAVRLWNTRTGEPITGPIAYHRNTGDGCVSYSPDGRSLLLARGGNEAWLRELRPESASLEELTLLAEVLSCTRFVPSDGMVPLDDAGLARAWQQLRALRANPARAQAAIGIP